MVQNWCSYPNPALGEEVVICGISGLFPKSDNIIELKHNLYNGINLISEDNSATNPDIPKYFGRVNPNIVCKFDNKFFNIPDEQIRSLDPMTRIHLEKTYEAIIDAGLNPDDLRGTKTGVYTASSMCEADSDWIFTPANIDGYGVIGNSRAMLANHVSLWLDLHGPSYNLDAACSSYLYAVEHGYRDLRAGIVDCALVGTGNLGLAELTTLQFARLGVLSKEGVCRTFDEKANGYVRSETIGCMVLMRAKDAKRIYSYIVHSKTNCDGYKPQGITFPSAEGQHKLLSEFYNEITILPKDINYVECHGTGTKVGDVEECISVERIFCKDRKTPLKIGSVKSNLGHSEPSSGLCAIAKCILSMESGLIPPNLHYNKPRQEIRGLIENKFEVVDKITPLDGDYMALSGFGFGGANAHLLLKRFKKLKKNHGYPSDDLPRLVCVSGRTQDAVNTIIHDLQKRSVDVEHVRLYHGVYRKNIKNHDYRGYVLLQKSDPRNVGHATKFIKNLTTPAICYVFTGVGSQWAGMGITLMQIPKFAATMHKLNKYLDPLCVDIVKIITDTNPKVFDNPLYAILGTTAIQIGLVDVLNAIGIEADQMIGYSTGEFACAYADNCLTAEQTILAAYYRGLTLFDSKMIGNSMAVSDLNSNKLLNDYTTEINSDEQINKRKRMEISGLVVILEISPDNSLVDMLKDVIDKKNVLIESLMQENDHDLNTFFNIIGNLYTKGFNPQLATLYPEVQFPVSCGTPMIGHTVKWEHSRKWPVPKEGFCLVDSSLEKTIEIDVTKPTYEYLTGHVVDGLYTLTIRSFIKI
ncbi:fatty acid synthase-like [Chrysoperla carnea]|uniref:fatty acid synthase-like n=1 Tax=Chrysoperla carnea TaxID=189513 RepID=UPI001D05D1AA|nr:fatty acid synthase-like [Chrysoperla carnea]